MYKYDDNGFEIKASYEKLKEIIDRALDSDSKPDKDEEGTLTFINEDWEAVLETSKNRLYVYIAGLDFTDAVIEIDAEKQTFYCGNEQLERYIKRYMGES